MMTVPTSIRVSTTREVGTLASTDMRALRAALIRNAQAAERERLRNLARGQLATELDVEPDEEQVEQRADELERAKLSAAGKKGARRRRATLAHARRIEAAHASLKAQVDFLAELIDAIAPVDPDQCDHDWPGDLDADASCNLCALPYGDWSEAAEVVA